MNATVHQLPYFMTEGDLLEITGLKQGAKQAAWLRERDIPHLVNRIGRPIVVRWMYEAWKNPPPPAPTEPEPLIVPPKPVRAYEGSGLQRYHRELREAAAAREAARAAEPQLSPGEKRWADAERRKASQLRRAATVRYHANKRRVLKLQRTPPWADQAAIRAIYLEAQRLTRDTGIPHHVDHEIPLQGELVSGLHVHTNLQILTGSENSKKRNRFVIEP